jgi:hypothetical protein
MFFNITSPTSSHVVKTHLAFFSLTKNEVVLFFSIAKNKINRMHQGLVKELGTPAI